MGTRGAQTRERNPMWRGGRSVASNGYVLIRVGVDHHLADVRGYAYEHRLVAEKKIDRRLRRGEIAHHRDGNKLNNTPGNIEVLTHKRHHEEHRTRRDLRPVGAHNRIVRCACGCGGRFRRYDAMNRPRRYLPSHNLRSGARS